MTVAILGSRTKVLLQPGGWFLNNAGWVVGDERALLVDTQATEDRSRRLLDAVRTDTGARPLTAVLTHAHGDHANGARLVVEQGGTVLATPQTATTVHAGPHTYPMAFDCSSWGDITPPRITDTVGGPVELDLGGVRVDLLPIDGTAHTDGDLVALVREDGVLFAGDLVFAGVTPLAVSGSISGWLTALDRIADIDHAHLVPGHGPVLPAHSREVDDLRAYLEWLLDTASRPDYDHATATRDASARWAHWTEGERHAANLLVAEADLKGVPVSLIAAVGAMLTVTGGRIKLDL
ncbi:hypothetical protein ALI22I_30645 [Saccharothrix sp. ALI-22-I]|uniref:MBL fold metallo-hydrolase n=1 Tax=Saccharothrix sp. ALI-22-I TaxID=1933778 RepID=UPI00097BDE83|nr:MBL fold metallo-hydrolase [Saccharothrix sp. ALI-22-I]ONI84843.1 hypothetical protein ALI22I_30645 [Saccharothrix sp. ALI-22-I]